MELHASKRVRHSFSGPIAMACPAEPTPLIDDFPVGGPKIAWKAPGGVGMSGIAVAGEFCFTLANRDGKQVLLALDGPDRHGTLVHSTGSRVQKFDGRRTTRNSDRSQRSHLCIPQVKES